MLTIKLQCEQVLWSEDLKTYLFSLWGLKPFLCQEIPQLEDLVRGKANVSH